MNSLEKQMDSLNKDMQTRFAEAKRYSDLQFHLKPSEEAWSLQQVLLHLCYVQDGVVTVLKKQVPKITELEKSGLKHFFSYIMLKLALRSDKKFKAPKLLGQPDNISSLESVEAAWKRSTDELFSIVRSFPQASNDRLVFKHPFVGWLSMNQTIGFVIDHFRHHQKQIEALYSWLDNNKNN